MRRHLVVLAALTSLGWVLSRVVPSEGEAQAASVSGDGAATQGTGLPLWTGSRHAQVRLAADIERDLDARGRARENERRHALSLTQDALRSVLDRDPDALGSLSIGRANRGALFNAVQMPESPLWHLAEPEKAWGTEETVQALVHAVSRVNEAFVDSPPLWIGHLSVRAGGWLRPHRSHQTGRDADIGFYYTDGSNWYARGSEKNLDIPRNWVLIETLLRETDVELIFLDRSIQALLADYALATGADAEWLDGVFEGTRRRSQCTIRHEWGHATHMHVRFRSQVSRDLGARVHPLLVAARLMPRARY